MSFCPRPDQVHTEHEALPNVSTHNAKRIAISQNLDFGMSLECPEATALGLRAENFVQKDRRWMFRDRDLGGVLVTLLVPLSVCWYLSSKVM